MIESGILVTIASISGVLAGSLTIASHIYSWYQKYQQIDNNARIEKVVLISSNGKRIKLKDATLEQIQAILEDSSDEVLDQQ